MVDEPSLIGKLAVTAVLFAVAYAFWLTYREPAKNRVTRAVRWYVDATRFPPVTVSATSLSIAVITLAVAIAALISILMSSPWGGVRER